MQGLEGTERPKPMAGGKTELPDMVFRYEPNATARPQWAKKIKNLDVWIAAPLVIGFLVLAHLNHNKKTGWHWAYSAESWQFTAQILLFCVLGLTAKWCVTNYQLTITADAMSAHLPIPWRWGQWLAKLCRINWSISFQDIDRVELYIPKPAYPYLQQVQLGLVVRKGTSVTIRPALWVLPEQEPFPQIRAKNWLMKPVADLWRRNTPSAAVSIETAAEQLPLVLALRLRGVPTPCLQTGVPSHQDLLATRSLRWLLSAAVGTLIASVFIFISLIGQRLFTSLPWQAYIPSVLLAMVSGAIFLMCVRKEATPPPTSHSMAIFAVWILALALASPGAIQGLATLGRPSSKHLFAIAEDKAVAIKPNTRIPDIVLPPALHKVQALSNGAHLDIEVIEGRWGIWVYDDEPLIQLANSPSKPHR